ncbi:pentatricopeptide repeat-containing protein 2, mitochondrial [Mugil cephalus]|uniref:pentatricopeptide repeat-containing protein 2, mitochondrial n=1 Tax=Mugil cephalus TaxID=48193 RepID=UPI001FB7EC54|nr:pentatricopeptide repeat-containing protein 2, mitochondrial [Mugil cephalus]
MVQSVGNMALGRLGRCCRSLLHETNKVLFCGVAKPGWIESCVGAKRYLLSEDVIKLQDFQQRKLAVAHHAMGPKGNYFDEIRQKLQNEELILRDELKLLLHLCQTPDDMLVARDAIYRYHKENSNVLYGEFKFGPLFMRLCYELGMEDLAAATISDKNLKGFFHDTTSFNIAIDMLFIKGSYESAFNILRIMRNQCVTFNKDTLILLTATCYKLNTAESYRICTALIEEHQTKGHFIPRHAYCFAVALALKREDLEKAKTLYTQIMNTDNRLCLNFKVLILIMTGQMGDAVSILSASLLPNTPQFVKKPEFSKQVVDLLLSRSEGRAHMMQVQEMVTELEDAGQVSLQTLDDMLCHTPRGKKKPLQMLQERRISRRTLKPLNSNLLSE